MKTARHFKYPMYLVMAFGVAELIAYYIQHFQQTSIFLPFGTMLFTLLLVWIRYHVFMITISRNKSWFTYRNLRDTDTDTMNRNAYEKKVNRLNVQKDKLHTTGLILFDLDNLKIINDRFT